MCIPYLIYLKEKIILSPPPSLRPNIYRTINSEKTTCMSCGNSLQVVYFQKNRPTIFQRILLTKKKYSEST
jgi:ribosomal protein L34E